LPTIPTTTVSKECAVTAASDYIVTHDDDLLRLREYSGIKIVKVADFLPRGIER
jgi:predicted nucleic acid-binding protein